MTEHPINYDWKEYYQILELIRRSGITNMWGASPYLAKAAQIDDKLATSILLSWIENYSEIAKWLGWER